MTQPYYGHVTKTDGTHVELSSKEAEDLCKQCEEADARRAKVMPTFTEAAEAIVSARQRMKDLGWADGIYCPQDGSSFAVVTFGSTGIITARYRGKYPAGSVHRLEHAELPFALLERRVTQQYR